MISDETLTLLSQITGKPVFQDQAHSLFLHLNNEGTFAPNALVSGMLETLVLSNNALDAKTLDSKEHLFSDLLARDKFTGFYIHSALRTIYLDFAIARAGMSGQEKKNFLIMGDYFNLSSVNDAIGRAATNELMATICGIYLDSMTRAGVVDCLYHRSMGDEVTMIAVNTDEQKIVTGIQEAEKLTAELISSLGLERLRHKKYPNQSGAGLVMVTTSLKGDINHRQLKQQLDDMITTRKKISGFKVWHFFRRRGVEPQQFHTRASEMRIDRILHKYRHYRLSSEFNSEANTTTGSRSGLKQATALLIGRSIAWPRDDRIEYLRRHHDSSKIMLRADIYNLGGLNAVYGHDGADHVKAHLVRILFNTISAHAVEEPRIFDCGGGIIDVVVNTMPAAQIQKMVGAIQSNIYHQILSLSIAGYANAYNLSFAGEGNILLAQLPHPRGDYHGTGLVMATHAVERSYSLPEIIERLDKISNRTKMHNLAYLWHDENYNVWALSLNQSSEPVEIGMDRLNHGAHYLPFTDALRAYLQADDLPNIFERPVGQICEILFGTDMQAVLGFKKAIRLLQEKQVENSVIEQIDSYRAMDAALLKLGLPPLSVVSTQNRPAFIRDEPSSFKTMTLAEKLEDLPKGLTDLILQTQASFRTLRLITPHGHLPPEDAAAVLHEELITPDSGAEHPVFSERLYRLARLLDRGYTVLGRDIPTPAQEALRDFSLDVLTSITVAFDMAEETLLAKKLQTYVREQTPSSAPMSERMTALQHATNLLLEKLQKHKKIQPETVKLLIPRLKALGEQMGQSLSGSEIENSRG